MSHKRYREEKNCLNCGHEVQENFCSRCGQENLELRDHFFPMVNHVVSDYFHLDSKFPRSVVPLFLDPGFLTREYWEGRRARYIAPVRLFLFVTIVFMLFTTYIYNRYDDRVKDTMINYEATVSGYDSTEIFSMHDTTRVETRAGRKAIVTGKYLKDEYIEGVLEFNQVEVSLDFVFRNLKYVTFLLLPVYALWFKLFYRRQRPYYVDHVIYVMHLQTFIYLITTGIFIAGLLWSPVFGFLLDAVLLALVTYLFFSLRFLYRQPWWKTLIKSLMAGGILFFMTTFTIVGLILVDAFLVH